VDLVVRESVAVVSEPDFDARKKEIARFLKLARYRKTLFKA
jgi:hypothetical protein